MNENKENLSSQKATPSDGSETEDEKTYRKLSEWYLKQLRECQDELRAIKFSQPSPGLRVRASERLPDIGKEVFFEIKWANGETSKYGGHVDKATTGKLFWFSSQGNYPVEKYLDQIEWLEETPSVQPTEGEQKTGIDLIAQERSEQIEKHGRTLESDRLVNPDGQLCWAACMLLYTDDQESPIDFLAATALKAWDQKILARMNAKPYKDRLVIAGALIAAEIDRLQNTQSATPSEAQPIADKEVPEEIVQWIGDQLDKYGILAGSNIFKEGAIAMYHKMQERLAEHKKADAEAWTGMSDILIADKKQLQCEITTQAIQIAGLLASNKEWGEKYETIEKEMLDYKNLLLEVIGDVTVDDWTHRITRVIKKYLPTPTDSP